LLATFSNSLSCLKFPQIDYSRSITSTHLAPSLCEPGWVEHWTISDCGTTGNCGLRNSDCGFTPDGTDFQPRRRRNLNRINSTSNHHQNSNPHSAFRNPQFSHASFQLAA